MAKKIGVYRIRNIVNGKVYIGSTTDSFSQRFSNHISQLNLGKHGNPHLLRSWKKYGADTFVFEILEEVTDPAMVLPAEQRSYQGFAAKKK
jgi:group I intron endonuclease